MTEGYCEQSYAARSGIEKVAGYSTCGCFLYTPPVQKPTFRSGFDNKIFSEYLLARRLLWVEVTRAGKQARWSSVSEVISNSGFLRVFGEAFEQGAGIVILSL